MSLSELIDRHISGTGNGFEIDDIMSNGKYPLEVIEAIADIETRYRSADYRIGVSNPASFEELRELGKLYPTL